MPLYLQLHSCLLLRHKARAEVDYQAGMHGFKDPPIPFSKLLQERPTRDGSASFSSSPNYSIPLAVLRAGGADRRLHFLFFFRRRAARLHPSD
jgi:hypothetical protein